VDPPFTGGGDDSVFNSGFDGDRETYSDGRGGDGGGVPGLALSAPSPAPPPVLPATTCKSYTPLLPPSLPLPLGVVTVGRWRHVSRR
jgi:hypothetical protein